MSLTSWWTERKRKRALVDRSLAVNNDEAAIAVMVPELSGMGFVEGGAYILRELDKFRQVCTQGQAYELAGRLRLSTESWLETEGHEMPWWGNLVVLRTLEAEIAASQAEQP